MIAVDNVQKVLNELEPARKAVFARLGQLRRRARRQLILEGLTWLVGLCSLLAAGTLVADWWLRPEVTTRLLVSGLIAIAIGYVIWRRLVRPLTTRLDLLDLAAFLERREPGLGNRVATVLQLPGLLRGRNQPSPAMVRMAVQRESAALDQIDFTGMLDHRRQRRFVSLLAVALLVPILFCLIAPAAAQLWAARWFMGSRERWPQRNYLTLLNLDSSGQLLVPRGEPVVIQVESQPEFESRTDGWRLVDRDDGIVVRKPERPQPLIPDQVAISYRDPVVGLKHGILTRAGGSRFRYEMPPLAEPVVIELVGGDDWTSPVRLVPIDRPSIESLILLARAPWDSDGEVERFEGAENPLLFLKDTELELRLKSRDPLAGAALAAKEGAPPQLARLDESTYVAKWAMEQPLTLEIQMTSKLGQLSSRPAYLSIGLLKDREPRVTLRSSGVGRRVTPKAQVPFEIRAVDDFGLSDLALEIERTAPAVGDQAPKSESSKMDFAGIVPPQDKPPTEAERAQTLALAEYGLAAGSLVKLRGTASDQCHEGVQTGVSRWLNFQVVAPEELFYDILMRQRAQRTRFAKVVEMMQGQVKILDGQPSGEQVQGLLRTHQVIARQTWEVGNRLEATLVEMRLNELGTPQALELLDSKVIKPLRDLHAGQLAQLRPLYEALLTAQAVDALSAARPLAKEALDGMQKILAQMSQWESFVDVMNQLDEVSRLEKSLLDKTEERRKAANKDLFDE